MSLLDQVSVPEDSPMIATITGGPGLGKTTLAATFPRPIFIRVEDGMQAIPYDRRPAAFPNMIEGPKDLWDQLQALIKEDHNFKTVVIDSITALERIFIEDVVAKDPKKPASINQALGGYGAGVRAVAGMHGRVRKAAELLKRKGMHVIFIAHSDTKTIEPPDDAAYTRYELALNNKSMPFYVDDVDLVGYIKLDTFVKSDEGKAISTGKRLLCCHTVANNISKNRYGISDMLSFDEGQNPLYNYVSTLTTEQ